MFKDFTNCPGQETKGQIWPAVEYLVLTHTKKEKINTINNNLKMTKQYSRNFHIWKLYKNNFSVCTDKGMLANSTFVHCGRATQYLLSDLS